MVQNRRMRIWLAVLALIAATICPAADAAPKWAIVIHGGAGVIERKELTPEQEAAYREALRVRSTRASAF